MSQEKPLIAERKNDIVTLWFNRPRVLNAFNRELWRLLAQEFSTACSDKDVSVVILRGRGGVFSSGDDIREMHMFEDLEDARSFFEDAGRAIETIARCPKPVIMVVDRLAVGGGAELLLLADVVIAAEDAWISYPEARLALIPPILTTLGARILGYKQAKRLAITCEKITATQAQHLGIIDMVVPRDQLEDAVRKTAEMLRGVPSQSVKAVKEHMWRSLQREMTQILDQLSRLVVSDAARTAMHLFLSRKKV